MRLVLRLPTQSKAKQNSLILEPVATTLNRAVSKGMLLGLGSQEAQVLSSSSGQPPSSSPYWQSPAGSSWQGRKVYSLSPDITEQCIERVDLELRDNNLITGTGDFVSISHDLCLGNMV